MHFFSLKVTLYIFILSTNDPSLMVEDLSILHIIWY